MQNLTNLNIADHYIINSAYSVINEGAVFIGSSSESNTGVGNLFKVPMHLVIEIGRDAGHPEGDDEGNDLYFRFLDEQGDDNKEYLFDFIIINP